MSMGFWIKFWIAMPLRILLVIPHFVIKPFSKKLAFKYYEKNKLLDKIDNWIF